MALEKDIVTAGLEAQYDQKAKQLLSHKSILAHILVRTIDEFKGMNPKDAEKYIEGDVEVSGEDVNPLIVGRNTENEGKIYYDIIFDVRMRDGLSQIIVNIEVQKDEPGEYGILNRAVYYSGCMLSAQKGKDFTKSNYDGIKPVYSIWLCLNMRDCYWNHIHLANEALVGDYEWKGRLDLINIIMLGIPEKVPEKGSEYELHRLLGTLLSDTMAVEDRIDIIGSEYGVEMKHGLREEMAEMCNLSQGILERGVKQGMERGMQQGVKKMILKMYKNNITLEQIASISEEDIETVKAIINAEKQTDVE